MPAANPPAVVAPSVRPPSQPVAPVAAKPVQPGGGTTAPATAPAPSPTPSPSPLSSPTTAVDPTPKVQAAGVGTQRKVSHGGLASRVPGLGSGSPGSVAFVLFLAAAGASGAVWLARRVRL